jgi:hypothetical protein
MAKGRAPKFPSRYMNFIQTLICCHKFCSSGVGGWPTIYLTERATTTLQLQLGSFINLNMRLQELQNKTESFKICGFHEVSVQT